MSRNSAATMLGKGIGTADDYLAAKRTARGRAPSERPKRAQVWECDLGVRADADPAGVRAASASLFG